MAGLAGELAELWDDVREHPWLAVVELGSLAVCVLLFLGTIAALASGRPTGRGGIWLVVLLGGTAFVLFWTVAVPLYDRFAA